MKKTFLLTDISINFSFRIFFYIFSSLAINLNKSKISYKLYSNAEVFPNIKQIELIRKKEFAIAVLNMDNKTFIIHITF